MPALRSRGAFRLNSWSAAETDAARSIPPGALNPGMRALTIAPPPGYLKSLTPLPNGLTVSSKAGGSYPFVQVFATRLSFLTRNQYIDARGSLLGKRSVLRHCTVIVT